MTGRNLPGLGLVAGYSPGENGWGTAMTNNLRMLSAIVQGKVLSRIADLPGSPTDGDIYMLSGTDDSNSEGLTGDIALRDNGAWVYLTPAEGWEMWVEDEEKKYRFLSGAWTEIASGTSQPIDIGIFIAGVMTANERVATYVATRAFDFADNFSGSQAYAQTGDSAVTIALTVMKNGVAFGHVTFLEDSNSAALHVGTFLADDSNSAPMSFVAGDRLELFAPATPGLWADISITFAGTRA